MTEKWRIKHGKFEIKVSKDLHEEFTNLNIVPVERAFPHNQQVSLRVRGAESLLTKSQEASGTGQVEQRWDPVGHSIGLLVEKHSPRGEVWRPHDVSYVQPGLTAVTTVTIDKDVNIQDWDSRVMDYDSGQRSKDASEGSYGWIRLGFMYFIWS